MMDFVYCANLVIHEQEIKPIVRLVNCLQTPTLEPGDNSNNSGVAGIGLSLQNVNEIGFVTENCHENISSGNIKTENERAELGSYESSSNFPSQNQADPAILSVVDIQRVHTKTESGHVAVMSAGDTEDIQPSLQTESSFTSNIFEVKTEPAPVFHSPSILESGSIIKQEYCDEFMGDVEDTNCTTEPTIEAVYVHQDSDNEHSAVKEESVEDPLSSPRKATKVEAVCEVSSIATVPTAISVLGKAVSVVRLAPLNIRKHLCMVCHKLFSSTVTLKRHRRLHSVEDSDAEDQHSSAQQTTTEGTLCQSPEVTVIPQKPVSVVRMTRLEVRKHICDVCHKLFPDTTMLKKHLCINAGASQILSRFLQKASATLPRQKRLAAADGHAHSAAAAQPLHSADAASCAKVRSHRCPQCRRTFRWLSVLTRHMLTHFRGKPFLCPICGKRFTQNGLLINHIHIHSVQKMSFCSECGEAFASGAKLRIHVHIHRREKPFSCSGCGKMFASKGKLRKHVSGRFRAAENLVSCSECGKAFVSKGKLIKHIRVHTGEKPFFCYECGKAFASKGKRRKHVRVHTGEKPFSCDECGRAFASKRKIRKHLSVHTWEKQLFCSEYGKAFAWNRDVRTRTGEETDSCGENDVAFPAESKYKQHVLADEEKSVSCGTCHKTFSSEREIGKHVCLHAGEKQFSCCKCSKPFADSSSLEEHFRKHLQTHNSPLMNATSRSPLKDISASYTDTIYLH